MSKTLFGRFRSEDGTVTRCDMTMNPPGLAPLVEGVDARSASSHLLEKLGLTGQARERLPRQMMEIGDDEAAQETALL